MEYKNHRNRYPVSYVSARIDHVSEEKLLFGILDKLFVHGPRMQSEAAATFYHFNLETSHPAIDLLATSIKC